MVFVGKKSELILNKIPTNSLRPAAARFARCSAKKFSSQFLFCARFLFLLKGKENFFAGLCFERARRRGFASAQARRNSLHTPLPPRLRLGWRNFLRRLRYSKIPQTSGILQLISIK